MTKLEQLIQEKCPNGVEYKPLWQLTAWDKKFNSVDKSKQAKVIKYNYFLAADLKKYEKETGNVKILTTSETDLWADEYDVKNVLSVGEIVCIPWGGNPIVQYYNGKFITGDNRIATSLDTNILNNKYMYYCLQNQLETIASFYRGSGIKHPDMSKVLELQLPVPPLEVQREIVEILDKFTLLTAELTAELTARKEQFNCYLDFLLDSIVDYENTTVSNLIQNKYIQTVTPKFKVKRNDYLNEGNYPIISQEEEYISGYWNISDENIKNDKYVCFGDHSEHLKYVDFQFVQGADGLKIINTDESKVIAKYLYYSLLSNYVRKNNYERHFKYLLDVDVKIPSIEEQQRIVDILDRFDTLCNDISSGLPAEIEARQKQYEYYRDKLLTFKRA